MTKKISLLVLSSLLFALGASAEAQQPKKISRIGILTMTDLSGESARSEGIRLALRELGYIEGQNIAIDYRYAEGNRDRLPVIAAELERLKVDIIVVSGGDSPIRAAKNVTKTIPIVLGAGLGSRRSRFRCKPCPARRQHHRPNKSSSPTRR